MTHSGIEYRIWTTYVTRKNTPFLKGTEHFEYVRTTTAVRKRSNIDELASRGMLGPFEHESYHVSGTLAKKSGICFLSHITQVRVFFVQRGNPSMSDFAPCMDWQGLTGDIVQ